MGGRRQRAEAVSTLKDAMTRQFGENSRSMVETQIDSYLSGGKGTIGRQDLDVIEKGILTAMRAQRGSTRTTRSLAPSSFTKSAPTLPLASTSGARGQTPMSGLILPPTPAKVPILPLGTSNPGALSRSSSAGGLTAAPKFKPRRPAPYGLSVTGTNEFVDESARDGVKLKARYPVPMPPKLKPMDHWDLLVAYDSSKYRAEERMIHETGTYAKQAAFKKTLDDQMIEIQEMRDNEARGQEEERELMLAQVIENKRYAQEEVDTFTRKAEAQGAINASSMDEINIYRAQCAAKKQRESEEMTRWLGSEKDRREEDDRIQKIEYARKCAAAIKGLEEHRALCEERVRLEQENEMKLMKIRDQIADEVEYQKQKAMQDRKDGIERNEKSVGAGIADRDAKDAADLEARIKRVQEESNRRAMEDATYRKNTHNAKVKDMMALREQQIEAKGKDDAMVRQQDKDRLKVYKADHEQSLADDKAKVDRARKAREDQDITLIGQIRRNAGIHSQHIMMTPRNRKTELGYNKAIFEQMYKEGFMTDSVDAIHNHPEQRDHHPEGKLCPFPTIPRYKGDIHPLELEQPDV